ncbi:MAG: response regulator, partial [Desulfobacterales bacterium]|nr:response regulator [Desulfobacterales bacterium]
QGKVSPSPKPIDGENLEMIRGARILLVEDNEINQQVADELLTQLGLSVFLAGSGKMAMETIQTQKFDLVFMDIQMPLMDGWEATRLIRKHEKRSTEVLGKNQPKDSVPLMTTPIIAMTAHAIKGYKEKCLEAGMNDFISKPLKKQDIIDMVLKWTGKKDSLHPDAAVPDSPGDRPVTGTGFDTTSPLDLDKALDEFDNDHAFFNEVMDDFLGNVDTQIPQISQAVAEKDFSAIKREAHAIKGGAANLTAMALSKTAAALEEAGKSEDIDEAVNQTVQLKTDVLALKNYIETMRSKND